MKEPPIDIANEEAAMDALHESQEEPVYISKEMICCDTLPMLVEMPETLICQVCGKRYMELMRGVQKPYIGVFTIHKVYM